MKTNKLPLKTCHDSPCLEKQFFSNLYQSYHSAKSNTKGHAMQQVPEFHFNLLNKVFAYKEKKALS